MANNYFQPRNYFAQQAPQQTPVFFQPLNQFDNLNYLTGNVREGVAGQNQGARAVLGGMLWGNNDSNGVHTPGIFEQANQQMGYARDQTKAATLGFGSIKWVPDNPNTPQDESLIPQYDANTLGKNERGAAQGGQQQANARGMMYSSFGDQMVGAALQRVGEQARSVINQYAGQINQIANNAQAQASSAISQLGSLYGQDITADAQQTFNQAQLDQQAAANQQPSEPTMQMYSSDPNLDPTQYNVVKSGNGSYISLKISDFNTPAGTYAKPPVRGTLDKKLGAGNYVIVKNGGKWEVRTR